MCKFFLEAIETKKYGWFWECPNGGDKCIYMHCLPPGFVLKTTKKEEEEPEEIPIEEQIEEEVSNSLPQLIKTEIQTNNKDTIDSRFFLKMEN